MSTVDERAVQDAQLSTQPAPDAARKIPGQGLGAQLLRAWRNLTSMRTALVLLFLLAIAAVPGSMLPQRALNQLKVDDYFAEHPKLAPFLDKLSAFDVYGSPWFAAIYLLLFVSLIGCVVPRMRMHLVAMFRQPPDAPRHLDRLPMSETLPATVDAAAIAKILRRRRWRTVVRTAEDGTVTVSAEKGYLRETGNLFFHFALVAVLAGVALGGLLGWKASILVVEGDEFCNTVQSYDQFSPGRLVGDSTLPPFCVRLDDFHGKYLANGQPSDYAADVRHISGPHAAETEPDRRARVKVNSPLRVDGANVYLINHGYAPVLRFKDRYGTVFESVTPFLPQDVMHSSEGVVVIPDANQDPKGGKVIPDVQVAFEGIYVPTMPEAGPPIRSRHPAEKRPGLTLLSYRGDTGLNSGIPRSVYSLDQAQVAKGALKAGPAKLLKPGETWKLDDGTELTFVGTKEWASMEVRYDPGHLVVLIGAIVMVLGLIASLTVRRRRIWFRLADGRVAAGGLARTDAESFSGEFRRTVLTVALAASPTPAAASPTPAAPSSSPAAASPVPADPSPVPAAPSPSPAKKD